MPNGTDETTKTTSRDYHVGDSNYSNKELQPWDVWLKAQLNPWDADIVKRIMRTKIDAGMTSEEQHILDYQKIQHICQERIEQINNGDPYYHDSRFLPIATLYNMTPKELAAYFKNEDTKLSAVELLLTEVLCTHV